MPITSNNMKLTVWNSPSDTFQWSEIANNFTAIDQHDHTTNKGVQLGTGAFLANSVTNTILSSDASVDANRAVTTNHIRNGAITRTKIASDVFANRTTSLSSGSFDGQEVNYVVPNQTGVIWNLKWNQSGSRWEFIGGSPMSYFNANQFTTEGYAANTWTNPLGLATILSIPQTGKYRVNVSARLQAAGGNALDEQNKVYFGIGRSIYNPDQTTTIDNTDLKYLLLNVNAADVDKPPLITADTATSFETTFTADSGTLSSGDINGWIQSNRVTSSGTPSLTFVEDIAVSFTPIYITL